MMVAAHPFDLKGAREAGLRTAFIDRPLEYGAGSPPREDREADVSASDLDELAATLEDPIGSDRRS
jgi:2-haloacid dehalogenase